MNIYSITVDFPAQNYKDYCTLMSQYESHFVRQLIIGTTPIGAEVSLKELIASRIEDGRSMIDTDRVRSELLLKAAVVLFDYVDDKIVDFDEAEKYVRKVLHDPKILL